MNISFILATVAALNFDVAFESDDEEVQFYFFLKGNSSQATLYRQNNTLLLHLTSDDNFESYKYSLDQVEFIFSWNDFLVNDNQMTKLNKSGTVEYLYDEFNFLSLWLHEPKKGFNLVIMYHCQDINYIIIAHFYLSNSNNLYSNIIGT